MLEELHQMYSVRLDSPLTDRILLHLDLSFLALFR